MTIEEAMPVRRTRLRINEARGSKSPRSRPATAWPGTSSAFRWPSTAVPLCSALSGSNARGDDSGAAYVFERRDGKWSQLARLTASDGTTRDAFGFAVAASNDTIVVGAPNHSGNGERAGAAYVFERRGDVWNQAGKLTASDAAPATWFGNAVAIGRDTIVVGMLTNGYGKRSGAAYVFERQQGRWLEVARLLPEVQR